MEGFWSGEGPSTEKAKLPPGTVNVNGYMVPMENSHVLQDIFCLYPNILSGFRFHMLPSKNGIINTLIEVYKMARKKEHTLEDIKYMDKGIEDLELAGLKVPELKALVGKHREEVEDKEGQAKAVRGKGKTKRVEGHNSKRQKA
ncbi:hypothetical protein DITRI_Ditri11bG0034000 [Diplodiscus trichospermus]